MLLVSSINVLLWLAVARHLLKKNLRLEVLACLSAVYVFGCAFRAVLPRADVQRICLFDNWLSSVLVGRSIATVAEVCFAAQWAVVLYCLADSAQSGTVRKIAKGIVPLIILAECCSWYAVITTDYLGNTVENSLWGVTFLEISRDPVRSYPLIKYSYLEKMVTSASVIVAYRRGNVPKRVLAATVVTDIAWIPVFVAVHAALSRSLERAPA